MGKRQGSLGDLGESNLGAMLHGVLVRERGSSLKNSWYPSLRSTSKLL